PPPPPHSTPLPPSYIQCYRHPPHLHSFPTRRSSDLICCGGTVATMVHELLPDSPSRLASSRTQASSRPQVSRCGTGVPVEPEVNTQAASCAVSIAGTGAGFAVSAAPPPGNGTRGRSMSQSTASVRQTT